MKLIRDNEYWVSDKINIVDKTDLVLADYRDSNKMYHLGLCFNGGNDGIVCEQSFTSIDCSVTKETSRVIPLDDINFDTDLLHITSGSDPHMWIIKPANAVSMFFKISPKLATRYRYLLVYFKDSHDNVIMLPPEDRYVYYRKNIHVKNLTKIEQNEQLMLFIQKLNN